MLIYTITSFVKKYKLTILSLYTYLLVFNLLIDLLNYCLVRDTKTRYYFYILIYFLLPKL
jgi:hypothetical protein